MVGHDFHQHHEFWFIGHAIKIRDRYDGECYDENFAEGYSRA